VTSAFLDTNVLLYLLSADVRKADRAEALMAGGGVISVQVLNEFAHVALRKFQAPWPAVHTSLDAVRAHLVVTPLTVEAHALGLEISERRRLSVFDGQLLACALISGCDVFYSEDLQHGQIIADLTIRNPFLDG
jgi:predicted nucleic acid-binding protein